MKASEILKEFGELNTNDVYSIEIEDPTYEGSSFTTLPVMGCYQSYSKVGIPSKPVISNQKIYKEDNTVIDIFMIEDFIKQMQYVYDDPEIFVEIDGDVYPILDVYNNGINIITFYTKNHK